jgi:hypothetical protein
MKPLAVRGEGGINNGNPDARGSWGKSHAEVTLRADGTPRRGYPDRIQQHSEEI